MDLKRIFELYLALFKKNAIAAIILLACEVIAIVALCWCLTSCTSNLFVQRNSPSASITTTVQQSVDSTHIIVPREIFKK